MKNGEVGVYRLRFHKFVGTIPVAFPVLVPERRKNA